MALTKRQKEAVDFIADFIQSKGYSPSFEEIAEGLGLASIATVHKHLTALASKGYLTRSFNQSRALDLGPQYRKEERDRRREQPATVLPETPLLGTIAAGQPVEAYADQETLSFADFCGAENVYALKVRGESMIDDHIMEGDYVLVEKTDRVRNGEIVVALLRGEETTLSSASIPNRGRPLGCNPPTPAWSRSRCPFRMCKFKAVFWPSTAAIARPVLSTPPGVAELGLLR